jgi:hypothetical protein
LNYGNGPEQQKLKGEKSITKKIKKLMKTKAENNDQPKTLPIKFTQQLSRLRE